MNGRMFKWVTISIILFFVTVWAVVFFGISSGKMIHKLPEGQRAARTVNVKTASRHVIMKDLSSGQIVYQKNSNEKIRPASLTKMMTALVVIENTGNFDEKVTVPRRITEKLAGRNISVAGFRGGEKARIRDLIYGMLFESGAECCQTMAEKVAGSEKEFVKRMNDKASALGMKDTTFGNSVGLDYPDCFSTVADLEVLLEYALQNEMFRKVFTDKTHTIPPTNKHKKKRVLVNRTVEMFGAEKTGVFGGKRGYTPKADLCLATVAKVNNRNYICVSAKAPMTEKSSGAHVRDTIKLYRAAAKL